MDKLPILLHTQSRVNDKWFARQSANIVDQFPSNTSFKNFDDNYSIMGYDHKLFQQSFLQVVTETVYVYPTTYVSEKSIKPIVNKRPFVIIGPVGSLQNLRNIGFKTFGDYWDESYDTIQAPEDRLLAVVNIIDSICNKSIIELQECCVSMLDVLNFNFNFYVNEFKQNELTKLEQACIENLKSRYD